MSSPSPLSSPGVSHFDANAAALLASMRGAIDRGSAATGYADGTTVHFIENPSSRSEDSAEKTSPTTYAKPQNNSRPCRTLGRMIVVIGTIALLVFGIIGLIGGVLPIAHGVAVAMVVTGSVFLLISGCGCCCSGLKNLSSAS
ncbi:MAG: hypothetical protein KR126chlam2_01228 [Chlamydiae bacterium]|nr:hypothetical protein [Chlamydiota bacterium]